MSMQIRAIILYGHNGQKRPLNLRLNAVNVITGESRTGKTALLDIIDYCLGRGSCNVPEGVIRRTVAWYALLLQFPETQAFVARRAPAADENTSADAKLELGNAVTIPEFTDLAPNITVPGLIDALGRLTGISPNENVPPPGQTRQPLRATLDHAKFLVFQGQSEITNRELLFHRQGEPFIGQSIKDTLPYFLGAVADKSLMLRAQLREAKQELQRLQRQQADADQIRGTGDARALALASEAVEVGLLAQVPASNPRQSLRFLLATPVRPTDTGDQQVGGEALNLRTELAQLRRRYQELQDQIQAATTFNDAQSLFEQEVQSQQARLETIDLLPPSGNGELNDRCPLCQSTLPQPIPAADDLRESLLNLRSELSEVGSRRPRVDEYINGLRADMAQVRRDISDRRQRLDAIESQNAQFRLAVDLERRQSHVLGRISLYLETVPEALADPSGPRRAAELQSKIGQIEAELGDDTIKEAVDSALSRIGTWMTEGAVALSLEYQPNPHRLDLTHLTVVADTEDRDVRMSQMGSAENWLGCHLISHIALHRWFASKKRPVPRFLFIDQPTSAYYPPDNPSKATDKDRAAVARMYKWLVTTIAKLRPTFQLLIVDHADLDEPWFKECVVERWRDGTALIPQTWLTGGPDAAARSQSQD